MSDLYDYVHDHVVHAVDAVTGALSRKTPDKPSYTATKYSTPAGTPDVGTGIAAAGAQTLSGEKAARDKAIADAS